MLLGRDAMQKLNINIAGGTLPCFSVDQKSLEILPNDLRGQFGHLSREDLGVAKNLVHQVRVRPDMQPKLRRLPLSLREEVTKELVRMEAARLIERVNASPWASPLVVVRKMDNTLRLCVDLRAPKKARTHFHFHTTKNC
ncbi:uncharacterized protein LOC135376017 [Ornithodoros turicata]|uniref:uncharacterized protein LOC135376017 n=1 Tax=Ornithodoros turicata TaxID=34597 RepID=UPI00313A3631